MQNGVQDEGGLTLPETQIDEQSLAIERAMAKFAKSPEFARQKEYLESRIDFYKTYLPDGRPITELKEEERGKMWLVATLVIAEINAFLNSYSSASEAIKDVK
jgi:hypothetical protein